MHQRMSVVTHGCGTIALGTLQITPQYIVGLGFTLSEFTIPVTELLPARLATSMAVVINDRNCFNALLRWVLNFHMSKPDRSFARTLDYRLQTYIHWALKRSNELLDKLLCNTTNQFMLESTKKHLVELQAMIDSMV